MMKCTKKTKLDSIYNQYNRRSFVHPDPLEFLYSYKDIRDREIAGLIASALAYGRVSQILKSVSSVLGTMNESPYLFLQNSDKKFLLQRFKQFKHRFADGKNLAALLYGAKNVIARYGSLNECFAAGLSHDHENIFFAMIIFVDELTSSGNNPGHLIARPKKGSACKRMNLFLRWMVRRDRVDPGGWKEIDKSKLINPVDTHMHKIGMMLGFTSRKQANMKTAMEITEGFKKISPEDPVKYDFALTRFGIRGDMDINSLSSDWAL
jgi:uncharacterized protein (TIGR02757 family)